MPFATNAFSPATSSNGTALITAWWAARSVSWRAGSTYEPDQRRIEAGQAGAAGESFRRTTGRAAAAGGRREPAKLLSALRGCTAGRRDTGVLRLVFLEMVKQPRPICRDSERGEGRPGGAVKNPDTVAAAQIRHPGQHQYCRAVKRCCGPAARGRCLVWADQRVHYNVAAWCRRSGPGS